MVIISSCICDKNGKIILARQFQPISKMNLEESIKNFPKSISPNQQHTFIETNNLRYIYLPLESLYLLLMTNKNSNIIEDLETIRLLHKLVIELCPSGLSEETISKNVFEIILSFDDVISFGYRESVTISQVQNSLEMESSEEKLHLMLMKARMNEAKENVKKHQMEVQKRKEVGVSMMSSISSSGHKAEAPEKEYKPVTMPLTSTTSASTSSNNNNKQAISNKKGMQLGKKKAQAGSLEKEKVAVATGQEEFRKEIIQQEKNDVKKEDFNPLKKALEIVIEEKMNCSITKEGTLNNLEIIGDVFLLFRDKTKCKARIEFEHEKNKQITIKPHPNLNRAAWNDNNLIEMKDIFEPFAHNELVPTIKYKLVSKEMNIVPFIFTYWLSSDVLTIEVEYNSSQDRFETIEDVELILNFPVKENPQIKQITNSEYQMNKAKNNMVWNIASLNKKNSNSTIEILFSSNILDEELFPLNVSFSTNYTYYHIKPKSVVTLDDQEDVSFEVKYKFATENFKIL